MVKFVDPDDKDLGPARLLIVGPPKVGKTQLLGTFPNLLIADVDHGAGSVPCHRIVLEPNESFNEIRNIFKKIASAPLTEEGVMYPWKDGEPTLIKNYAVDTIDPTQMMLKHKILNGRTKMEIPDWGKLLEEMTPLYEDITSCPINVIWVSHSRDFSPDEKTNTPGRYGMDIQGALADKMPGWFDYIWFLNAGVDDTRWLIFQPITKPVGTDSHGNAMVSKYLAGDRHKTFNVFKSGFTQVKLIDDKPDPQFAQMIMARHNFRLGGTPSVTGRTMPGVGAPVGRPPTPPVKP